MNRVEFLYLSQEDVLDLNLSLTEIIDLVEQALREHGRGKLENPPKLGIHPKANSFIHEKERIFAVNIGLALEDVIVANRVYELARERDMGQKLTLMEREF